MTANERILARMVDHDTLVCCGLDPDLWKMPRPILERDIPDEEKVLEFLRAVVDETAKHICAYKAQKAFFDDLHGGHEVLKALIEHVHEEHPGIPVIVDCKIGDIENTMGAYTHNLFDRLGADGIVVNPYMGDDVFLPLAERTDKTIVVLVKTSNPAGGVVQDILLQDGQPLWKHILELVVTRWNKGANMVPVLASTTELNMAEIRPLIPDETPILLAGVGAQGGNYENLRSLLNSQGVGVFVNSSRGILYPQSQKPWRVAIEEAVVQLRWSLNQHREVL